MSNRSRWRILAISLAAVVLGGVFLFTYVLRRDVYQAVPLVFSGESDSLRHTMVLPGLESPIPSGQSAIWCASFQLAWNRLRGLAGGQPIRLTNGGESADILNRAALSDDDLPPASWYAAAGRIQDGIDEQIRNDMADRFPGVALPKELGLGAVAISYAYLSASIHFPLPYDADPEPLVFQGSRGATSSVGCFGIAAHPKAGPKLRRAQIEVLFSNLDGRIPKENAEYALDLCRDSSPSQLVVATVKRKNTLGGMLDEIRKKVAHRPADWKGSLGPNDTLLVPNMHFQIQHHFRELEGRDKTFLNPALSGLYLADAIQMIHFRLDRGGAEMSSWASQLLKAGPKHYRFDRPFLLYLQRRGAQAPYFVMWVDNVELLQERP